MATNKMFSTRFFHKVSLLSLMGLIAAENTYADFSQDTSGSLYLRNFFLERNFENPTATDVGSWSQAATLRLQSGYTDTPIRVGVGIVG
ncbi:OprD family outer membrane porin, partial [Acinetobacter soli]|uniref:OprD family outer membrane porin n=1 Tax=Acinetobacter soli TaxID=487316 RepID=UPI00125044D0